METLLSILAIVVGPILAGALVLLIFRRDAPIKERNVRTRLIIALTLIFVLTDLTKFAFSISSTLYSIAIGLAFALVIGPALAFIEASIKSKSTEA